MLLALVSSSVALGACGTERQASQLADSNPDIQNGARVFAEKGCQGCHSLEVVGAEGSATKVRDRERVDGPNFNVRKEQVENVLYAIRNGGYSGAIMPENIVVGKEADDVAEFLAKYSGLEAANTTGGANQGTLQPQQDSAAGGR